MPKHQTNFVWNKSDNREKTIKILHTHRNGYKTELEKDIEQDHERGKWTEWLSPTDPLYGIDDGTIIHNHNGHDGWSEGQYEEIQSYSNYGFEKYWDEKMRRQRAEKKGNKK